MEELKYPCEWDYRIIGTDESSIRHEIIAYLGDSGYSLNYSNTSSKGKYISLNLKTRVLDQGDRDRLFNALKQISGVKMVL